MAKKATTAEGMFQVGEARLTPQDQGVSVAVGSGKPAVVGWAAIARLAATSFSVEQLLSRLDAWLAKNRANYHKGLLPGAPAKALTALGKTLGRPLPGELKTWLGWHDGQKAELIGAFRESFNLLSAEQIAQEWREREKASEPCWHGAWIPILDDNQGDLVVLDPTSPGCVVRELWRGAEDAPVVALSLRQWLGEFVADVEGGFYHEDPERGEFHHVQ